MPPGLLVDVRTVLFAGLTRHILGFWVLSMLRAALGRFCWHCSSPNTRPYCLVCLPLLLSTLYGAWTLLSTWRASYTSPLFFFFLFFFFFSSSLLISFALFFFSLSLPRLDSDPGSSSRLFSLRPHCGTCRRFCPEKIPAISSLVESTRIARSLDAFLCHALLFGGVLSLLAAQH